VNFSRSDEAAARGPWPRARPRARNFRPCPATLVDCRPNERPTRAHNAQARPRTYARARARSRTCAPWEGHVEVILEMGRRKSNLIRFGGSRTGYVHIPTMCQRPHPHAEPCADPFRVTPC